MFESQWIDEQLKKQGGSIHQKPSEYPTTTAEELRNYEPKDIPNDTSLLMNKLQLHTPLLLDKSLEIKIKAVDEYIKELIIKEGLRNTKVTYETILDRNLQIYPEPLERMLINGKHTEVLNHLFRLVALSKQKHSETYLREYTKQFNKQKVVELKKYLKLALQK